MLNQELQPVKMKEYAKRLTGVKDCASIKYVNVHVCITDIPATVVACLMLDNQNASQHLIFGPLSKDS